MVRYLRILATLVAAGLLFACSTGRDLIGRDGGATQFTVRVVSPRSMSGGDVSNPTGDGGEQKLIEYDGIEGAFDFASGHFRERVNNVGTDYYMWQASVASRFGSKVGDVFEYGLIGGVVWHELDFDFSQPVTGVGGGLDRQGFGVLVGAEFAWKPIQPLALHARATYSVLPFNLATSGQLETGLRVHLFRGLNLFAGYRYWRFRDEAAGRDESGTDIDLVAKGFVFGTELRF